MSLEEIKRIYDTCRPEDKDLIMAIYNLKLAESGERVPYKLLELGMYICSRYYLYNLVYRYENILNIEHMKIV